MSRSITAERARGPYPRNVEGRIERLTEQEVYRRHPWTLWRQWLAEAEVTGDPEGDLISDMAGSGG